MTGYRSPPILVFALILVFFLAFVNGSLAAPPLSEQFNPAEYLAPEECSADYEYKKDNYECAVKAEQVKLYNEKECIEKGFSYDADEHDANIKVCKAPTEKNTQASTCKLLSGYTATISGKGKDAKCVYKGVIPTAVTGDYIGDCFKINSVPVGSNLKAGEYYFVSNQYDTASDDKELVLVRGGLWSWSGLGCNASEGGGQFRISASKLIEAGASRYGYAYGLLTMPYKYFPGKKSFISGIPLGPYVGWRAGQAGSGMTVAAAITLGTVQADTVDPDTLDDKGKPVKTGTTNTTALSGAIGIIFDLLKSPRGKPFKYGMFYGVDFVNKDPKVEYEYNGKHWVAVQIGFDFTDN